jgi:hypothetical protein
MTTHSDVAQGAASDAIEAVLLDLFDHELREIPFDDKRAITTRLSVYAVGGEREWRLRILSPSIARNLNL